MTKDRGKEGGLFFEDCTVKVELFVFDDYDEVAAFSGEKKGSNSGNSSTLVHRFLSGCVLLVWNPDLSSCPS